MGNCIRSLLKRLRTNHGTERTIILLIVGLDNAGKSLILNHISGDPDRNVLPTMGFRMVSLKHKSYLVKIYDIGGSSQIRALWPKYYNDIHGLIYVVDASDISRLAENKVVFSELITHEHISTKPLLLLANKQDLNGAIDELDLVENLDVERAANAMKCPTRVETCSCVYDREQSKNSTLGIKNGYKWLLDTIVKNYAVLNSRTRQSQRCQQRERVQDSQSVASNTPSRISVHSNPFKPIKDLLATKDELAINESRNGTSDGISIAKVFVRRNKTAPLPVEQPIIEFENLSPSEEVLHSPEEAEEKSTQTITTILDPLNLETNHRDSYSHTKLIRPYTAPERSQRLPIQMTIINIPGQVPQ